MSVILQKKKFKNTNDGRLSDKVLKFERDDSCYKEYLKTYEAFMQGFETARKEGNLVELKRISEQFEKQIKTNENLITDLAKQGEDMNNLEETFLIRRTFDVINFLSDYLLLKESTIVDLNKTSLWNSPEKLDKMTNDCREVTLLALKIIKLFSMVNSSFALNLSNKSGFVLKLLELILESPKMTRKQAMSIFEALLTVNPSVITSDLFPLFRDIMSTLSPKYFSRFSRIIAFMVLEPADKSAWKGASQFSPCRISTIHNFLLSVPNFLENYVQILEYLQKIMTSLNSSNFQNLKKILDELTESNALRGSGMNLNALRSLLQHPNFSEAMASEILNPKFIAKMVIKKSNITELLFVLSNLLSSRRKIDVQDQLIKIGFTQRVLIPLFDFLFHPSLKLECADNSDDRFCNSPLSTTRLQLLRIIINLNDRDSKNVDNKNLLLSAEELAAVDQIMKNPQNQGDDYMTKNAFENIQEKGFIHKIILLLQKLHPDSTFSFWLTSCVESFLRCFHAPHQIFVARTGIMYSLVKRIVNKEITKFNNVQISYDLMGELIKFNKENMCLLENICTKYKWTEKFSDHAAQNVVDSNVFFRSLWISFEKLKLEEKTSSKEIIRDCIPNLYGEFQKDILKWSRLLIDIMEPNLVSQDNVCCINTLMIMAIFVSYHGNLDTYLSSLLPSNPKESSVLMETFRSVLLDWEKYYTQKGKESFSLQFTSGLPFHSFLQVKQKILSFLDQHLGH